MAAAPRTINIYYASQTGCAESIARVILAEALEQGYAAENVSVTKLEKGVQLSSSGVAIFVISSTGQGDPPDHSLGFMREMRASNRKNGKWLPDLRFGLLGLGDTNYDEFQGNPLAVHRLLLAAGATEIYNRGAADDATGLEDVVEPWKAALWPALAKYFGANEPASEAEPAAAASVSSRPSVFKVSNSPKVPPMRLRIALVKRQGEDEGAVQCTATPITNATLVHASTVAAPPKEWLSLELQTDQPLAYTPGDAIEVHCNNVERLVDALLTRVDLKDTDPDALIHVEADEADVIPSHLKAPTTIRSAFRSLLDITASPRKIFLEMLSQYTTDESEKAQLRLLASHKGKDEFIRLVELPRPNLVDLLTEFSTCRPPIEYLLQLLPPLQPRSYSLSSSPLSSSVANRVSLLVGVERFPPLSTSPSAASSTSDGAAGSASLEERLGVCSGWLRQLQPEARLLISPRPSSSFTLSAEKHFDKPVMIVAVGTGISPFLSFLDYKADFLQQNPGKSTPDWNLFYGCQNAESSAWCLTRLQTYRDRQILTGISTAFSRPTDGSERKLVQDRLNEQGELVRSLLQEGTCFVCGHHDAIRDVTQTITNLLETSGAQRFSELVAAGRFLIDQW